MKNWQISEKLGGIRSKTSWSGNLGGTVSIGYWQGGVKGFTHLKRAEHNDKDPWELEEKRRTESVKRPQCCVWFEKEPKKRRPRRLYEYNLGQSGNGYKRKVYMGGIHYPGILKILGLHYRSSHFFLFINDKTLSSTFGSDRVCLKLYISGIRNVHRRHHYQNCLWTVSKRFNLDIGTVTVNWNKKFRNPMLKNIYRVLSRFSSGQLIIVRILKN